MKYDPPRLFTRFIVNELKQVLVNDFMDEIEEVIGKNYSFAHSDSGGDLTNGNNVVIWDPARFTLSGETRWEARATSLCVATHPDDSKAQIGVDLVDTSKDTNNHILVGSVHFEGGISHDCVRQNLNLADNQLDALRAIRGMTIMGGDLNERPDSHANLPVNGLEQDPMCWYRLFSALHEDKSGGSTCVGIGKNAYYDAVWLYPGSGGGSNPAAPAFCDQWTRANFAPPLPHRNPNGDVVLGRHPSNSCTSFYDVYSMPGVPEQLDHSRIDYIWIRWEDSSGNLYTPNQAVASGFVNFAGADLGLDPVTQEAYSDHRGVQALLTWPPVTL